MRHDYYDIQGRIGKPSPKVRRKNHSNTFVPWESDEILYKNRSIIGNDGYVIAGERKGLGGHPCMISAP